MKFSAVVLIVPEEDENRAVEILKEAGATGITILKGKGLRHNERKTFLGLGLERKESLLLCVVEKQLAMRILQVGQDADEDGPAGRWPGLLAAAGQRRRHRPGADAGLSARSRGGSVSRPASGRLPASDPFDH
jgi:nitrogen regulatory protein PII-like uncharacterized protein